MRKQVKDGCRKLAMGARGVSFCSGRLLLQLDGACLAVVRSNDPYFSSNRLCLLDRGFVFAMVRGLLRG